MRVGRPSVVWLCGLWVESSTRLGGFRALKKTPDAPYTTKVNNRKPTRINQPWNVEPPAYNSALASAARGCAVSRVYIL